MMLEIQVYKLVFTVSGQLQKFLITKGETEEDNVYEEIYRSD
jgi:hypothetical protein